MRVAFLDFADIDYAVDAPRLTPLGGTQSAVCYLAEELARLGLEVHLLNRTTRIGRLRGVFHRSLADLPRELLPALDVAVLVGGAGPGRGLRPLLGPGTKLLLWTGHAEDQPAVAPLADAAERAAYDGFAFVSDWQRGRFARAFGLAGPRARVLRNAVAPAFEGLFQDGDSIAAAKRPILAYTSTPFRGLDRLLDALPAVRAAAPEATLRVFSGMRVYRQDPAEEAARYGALYRRCAATPGAAYEGPVPQPALAAALRETAVLAYPNTFPETSCIAVLEALAAGCRVVTSDLGALGETSAGFAALVPAQADPEAYRGRFAREVVEALASFEGPRRAETEARLRAQVEWTLRECSWRARAWEWIAWFEALRALPSARAA